LVGYLIGYLVGLHRSRRTGTGLFHPSNPASVIRGPSAGRAPGLSGRKKCNRLLHHFPVLPVFA
jgi:hypothetical protein